MKKTKEKRLQLTKHDRADLKQQMTEAVEWLSQFGKDEGGGVTRLLYSSAWLDAQMALAQRLKQGGLCSQFDDCGNLFGRLPGTDAAAPVILTGSHIDTVICGGKYDGAYGILAGMIALQYLKKRCGKPVRTLEVVSLCEEEGSRFPLTYWGSGNLSGRYTVNKAPHVCDKEGITLQAAMAACGFGLGKHQPSHRTDVDRFIELHIEQGAVLEREQRTIGIVEGIVGQRRYTVCVRGIANHAGTTPMRYRSDALSGACAMISWIEQEARFRPEPFVSTVGQIEVKPNSSNVIPGESIFTIDIRDASLAGLNSFCEAMVRRLRALAEERGLTVEIVEWMDMEPAEMDASMNADLKAICQQHQLSYRPMFSGAGHDAQVISRLCPTTMLFVPSQDGISHSPLEYSNSCDLTDGLFVLLEYLYQQAYECE